MKVAEHELTGHKVAIKILNREKIKKMDVAEKINREIQILKLFRHPHIIKLYEVITTPTDIFMIMEYVPGGELFDYIVKHGKSSEADGRKFFQQIISGVAYCHRHMVVHRDLKPENLLLDADGNVKIGDFGLSNIMADGELLKTSCGSPNYAAPEVISGKLYAGPEVDVWSCGVILYALLCGTLPFDDASVSHLFKKIKSGHFRKPSHLSPSVVDLLQQMLQVNTVKRITIHQIMEHEWFKVDLPDYLIPSVQKEKVLKIDMTVVTEVCGRIGVAPMEVISALRGDDPHDQLSIAYHLIRDNKLQKKKASSTASSLDLASSPPSSAFSITDIENVLSTTVTRGNSQNKPKALAPSFAPHPASPSVTGGSSTAIKPPQSMKKSKWHLGIRSRSRPQDIMSEVFKKLKSLDFEWKVINSYHIIVREARELPQHIKMDLQLYQIDHQTYLLDFKSILPNMESTDDHPVEGSGHTGHAHHITMEFFEMCAKLIGALAQ